MIDVINKIYNDLKELDLPKYVLHNDLNQKNILKSDCGWKVIDPHGIVGEKILEATQFIRSELEYTDLDEMEEIIELVSKYLKEDKILIYKVLYINIFMKLINYINNKYDKKVIEYNIEVCEKISRYI